MIYENLKVKQCLNLAKVYKIKNISKLKKKEIIDRIVYNKSVLSIQRWYRSMLINNSLCPISLEKIYSHLPCYGFYSNGKFIYYDLESLIDNIFVSGEFRDPISRTKYTIGDLKTIDSMAKLWNVKKKSVYSYLVCPKEIKKRKKLQQKRDQLLLLQRILEDIGTEIIDTIENPIRRNGRPVVISTSEFYLSTVIFPNFRAHYEQYSKKEKDKKERRHIIDNCILNIKAIKYGYDQLKNSAIVFLENLEE